MPQVECYNIQKEGDKHMRSKGASINEDEDIRHYMWNYPLAATVTLSEQIGEKM